MPFPPLIRRRLRRYAEEALAKETDQGWATLIFACLKYGKRVKLFDSAGCEACRQRRIQSSEWLMALEASNDATAVCNALRKLHRLPDAEQWLPEVMAYTTSPNEEVYHAALEQMGRWLDRPEVMRRLDFLAKFSRFPVCKMLATQLAVAGGSLTMTEYLVRNRPDHLKFMPTTAPTRETYDAWLAALPVVPRKVRAWRPTIGQLRQTLGLSPLDELDDQEIRGRADAVA